METKNAAPFAITQKIEIFRYEPNKACVGLVYKNCKMLMK